ncbi:MAG: rRNA (cytosine967-C5)-methyltransferase [Verrucomicrobiota bacterium]|jgi:16S rRNA (cytosine967-C5)-methyltransferase
MPKTNSRRVALAALRDWRTSEKFADAILARFLSSSDFSAPDRAFVTELFYGILRHLSLLDFWIGSLRSQHLDHDARDLLRLGLYQLFLLDTPQHAAVYETVHLATARRRSLVNAVLRNALRSKAELLEKANAQDLSIRTSHSPFLIDRWTKNFGAEKAAALCEWNNRPPPIYGRVNRLKISVDDFLAGHPDAERLSQSENFVRLTNVPSDALAAGHCYIQDPSTAIACLLLNPKPGERVLDACAAPGGKTAYLAELMQNEGFVLACDCDESRLLTSRDNLERLGLNIAQFARLDWSTAQDLPETAATPFDRILVDAPCSNTGVMRRRVDLRWRLTPKDFQRMREEQLGILRRVIPLLKPEGILVYSTCSIEPEENEAVVETIMREFSFLTLLEEKSMLPFRDGFDGAYAAKLIRET